MASGPLQPSIGALPSGWHAVGIEPASVTAAVRLAILIRNDGDVGASFVRVRALSDGEVLLGCVASSDGQVREWLEFWVQRVGLLAGAPSTARGDLNNAALDERWSRLADAMRNSEDAGVLPLVATPRFIDPETMALADVAKGATLVRDAATLAMEGLPEYGPTLHRYLRTADGAMIAATDHAPLKAGVTRLDALAKQGSLLVLNPEGVAMIVRRHAPLSLEGFADYLGGSPAEESLARGRPIAEVAAVGDDAAAPVSPWMFASAGASARVLEAFHLKLCLIDDAVDAVRRQVRAVQTPLLNLTADQFRVSVADVGGRLPQLWTARASFVGGGDTVEVKIEGADGQYFLPLRAVGSPYRAAVATRRVEGFGMLRLRKVSVDGAGVTCEATLSSQDRIRIGKSDLLWVRIGMGKRRVDVWARVETQSSLAAGEWRLRTLPQTLPPEAIAQLKELEGQIVGEVPYELLPALSTPCDLFSLAVLAMRVLLVNSRRALPAVVDDVLSLASDLRHQEGDAAKPPLAARIESTLRSDGRWTDALGPANVMHEPAGGSEAAARSGAVPLSLWCAALANIVRMVPGAGPDAYRSDYGDAPTGGLHRVFDAPLVDWRRLAVQSRSLLLVDWRANREIDGIIRAHFEPDAAVHPTSVPRAVASKVK